MADRLSARNVGETPSALFNLQRLTRSTIESSVVRRLETAAAALWGPKVSRRIDLSNFDRTQIEPALTYKNRKRGRIPKRVMDIILSTTLLVGLAPLLVLVAVLIKLDSPGPIFYRQERVGLYGRRFHVIKFRSMVTDAERAGAIWAQKNDTRVTRMGKFIRKTRIDEIPQALNVLTGKMSFVGPRPERPEFVALLEEKVPFYQERHSVKPGITGWAQVEFEYGASVEDARTKHTYDLYYIKNFSLVLDFIILLKTVRVTLFGLGSR